MSKRVSVLLLWIAVGSMFVGAAVWATERVERGRCEAGNVSYCIDPTSQPQCVWQECPAGDSGQPERSEKE